MFDWYVWEILKREEKFLTILKMWETGRKKKHAEPAYIDINIF